MSDLSEDFCVICKEKVAGVMSGKYCRIAYVKGRENGVCLDCLDELIKFKERIKNAKQILAAVDPLDDHTY